MRNLGLPRGLLAILLSLLVVACGESPRGAVFSSDVVPSQPFMFFDLGDTIVDTSTSNFQHITYAPSAFDYLTQLRMQGYHLGLIVNIPEAWGADNAAKVKSLQAFIAQRWGDSRPMNWEFFEGNILVPPHDADRKPNPYLFKKALALAQTVGASGAVYQGEDLQELTMAKSLGFRVYQTGRAGQNAFIPITDL